MVAARRMRMDWKRKEAMRVRRRGGPRSRWKRLKRKDPMQKEASEVRDLSHRLEGVPLEGGERSCERPRPM
jgi:hypothetical protein